MPDSPTPNSPSAHETKAGRRSDAVRAIRVVLWLASAGLIVFGVGVGRDNLRFWGDLHRWEREPSVTLAVDLADPSGAAGATWDQDCHIVCKQGLWLRPGPGMNTQSLAGLSGTLTVRTDVGGEDRWPWSLGTDAAAGDDGLIHLLSVTPPPDGPAEIRVAVDTPVPGAAAGTVDFEFWPELCGIERMGATFGSAVAIGSGLAGALLGLVLGLTWTPRGRSGHATPAAK